MILRNVSPYCATQCRDTQHQTRYRSMNVRGSESSVTLKTYSLLHTAFRLTKHTHTRTVMKSPAHSSHYLHNPSSTFTCLLGFQNTLPPQIFNHLHETGNTQPLPHTQINTSLGDEPAGRGVRRRPAEMHDTAPHSRYTHATTHKMHLQHAGTCTNEHWNYISAPFTGPTTQHLVPPGLRSKDSSDRGRESDEGAKRGNDESNSSAPDTAKPRGSIQN